MSDKAISYGTDLENLPHGILKLKDAKSSLPAGSEADKAFCRGYWFGFNKGLELGRKEMQEMDMNRKNRRAET